jgi:hypothetical protein
MIFDIRRAKNGYILKVINGKGDSDEQEEIVYQEKYDEEVECFADFLRYLDEEYGPATSRHSEKRIYINVESGDKYKPDPRDS